MTNISTPEGDSFKLFIFWEYITMFWSTKTIPIYLSLLSYSKRWVKKKELICIVKKKFVLKKKPQQYRILKTNLGFINHSLLVTHLESYLQLFGVTCSLTHCHSQSFFVTRSHSQSLVVPSQSLVLTFRHMYSDSSVFL